MALRRPSTMLAVVVLVALGSSPSATATPTATIKITAVPIPGFPGTGNILGAGAMIQAEGKITGTEYGGFPPPVIGAKFYAPAGAKLHSQGFATCPLSVLENSGPSKCPKRSSAGPKGSAVGVVSFGGERVPETASVQPFFGPRGDLEFFVDGTSPALIEIVAKGSVVRTSPPFGLEIIGEVPLIETVPEAPDASEEQATIKVGAAYKRGRKTISYITMPKTCPRGGFPVKTEIGFLGGATAETSSKMPCPREQ